MKKSYSKEVILTPELAKQLLLRNISNRKISNAWVDTLANRIKKGSWKNLNGDTLKINVKGNLIDGQHRCWAVIKANKNITTFILYNISINDSDARKTLDCGRTNTVKDNLYILNYKYTSQLSSIYSLLYKIYYSNRYRPDTNEILKLIDIYHLDFTDVLLQNIGKVGRMKSFASASFLVPFLILYILGFDKIRLFDIQLCALNGIGLRSKQPILALRNYLMSNYERLKLRNQKNSPAFLKCLNAIYTEYNGGEISNLNTNESLFLKLQKQLQEKLKNILK